MNINEIVKEQALAVEQRIKEANGAYSIAITDFLCAACFKKYAESEDFNEDRTELKITFSDPEDVEVSIDDFIEYHFQFTETGISIENEAKSLDIIDFLRDTQSAAMATLSEKHSKYKNE